MGGFFSALTDWVSENAAWIAVISVIYLVVSLLVIRFLIVRIPADYFLSRRQDAPDGRHPLVSWGIKVGRNLLGILVILVGLIMSLPGVAGQGVVTILLGLSLTDFPGRRRVELRIVRQPFILRAINGIREKAGKSPLVLPDGQGGGSG